MYENVNKCKSIETIQLFLCGNYALILQILYALVVCDNGNYF